MKKVVLLDFDGVIADTFNFCLGIRQQSSPEMTAGEYRRLFEGNINDHQKDIIATDERKIRNEKFFKLYEPELAKQGVIVGMADVIEKLAESYSLFIVSSTTSPIIKDFLEKHGLAQYFVEILGNDVDYSKVKKIRMVLERYSIFGQDVIFITDTLGDILEANVCGVKSIGVSWGYHPAATLQKGNPLQIADKPENLVETVNSYLK